MRIMKRKRFMSFSDKSKSFIREKALIPSSIIHNNKTITITLFMASRSCRKRRSINTFQFVVKPIQGCLINAGDVLLPISIQIYPYRSYILEYPDRIHGKPTTNHEAIDRTTLSTCVSRNKARDKADFSIITDARMAPSNEQPWKPNKSLSTRAIFRGVAKPIQGQ